MSPYIMTKVVALFARLGITDWAIASEPVKGVKLKDGEIEELTFPAMFLKRCSAPQAGSPECWQFNAHGNYEQPCILFPVASTQP